MQDDADDPDERDELIGRTAGKYEIVRLLGKGGMGRVYEAVNPGIGKRVGIKMLHPDVAKNRDAVARFQREAQAASAAESPHIVEIFDSGFADDGSPFIVMELLRGETLASLLKREGRLAPEETSRVMVQVLRGLSRAHEAGIIHRDLKPDNIFLVDRSPEPAFAKILDFGVSKIDRKQTTTTLTREGMVLGTPAYMSPEQAQGLTDVDARSDLWAVGAILYECVAGKPPFSGATYEQIIVRICTTDPTSIRERAPDLPARLEEAISGCLRREREDRYASAAELLSVLGEHASLPRVARHVSVSPTAMTPTLEAPLAVQAERQRAKRSSRVVPLTIFGLSGAIALAAFLATNDEDEPTPSTTPATSVAASDGATAGPIVGPGTSPAVEASTTAVESAPTGSASAAPSASAGADPLRTAKRPAASAGTSAPVAETSASPPIPTVQTSAPKGVAGDLQIQRK